MILKRVRLNSFSFNRQPEISVLLLIAKSRSNRNILSNQTLVPLVNLLLSNYFKLGILVLVPN